MVRNRYTLPLLALAASAVLLLAGCPEEALRALAPPSPEPQNDVFQVLGETLTATAEDPPTFDATQLARDEAAFFGEDPALYQTVPFDDIELPAESVLPDVGAGDGDWPVAHGGLAGRYLHDVPDGSSDTDPGVFRGRWFSASSDVEGVLRGRYRPWPADELPRGIVGGGVFHGRFIGNSGRFRGFLRGCYGHRASERGFFFGHWLDRHERLVGLLEGHWEDDPNGAGGTFRGRWAAFNICDEADSLPESAALELEAKPLGVGEALPLGLEELGRPEVIEPAVEDDIAVTDEPDVLLFGGPPCIDPNDPHGYLRGWHWPLPPEDPADPQRHGFFEGRWRDARGRPVGRLFGSYVERPGESADRPRVLGNFRGSYVNRAGTVCGSLRGVYGVSTHGLGVFRGRYFNSDGEPLGILRGRWSSAPHRPGGPFFGFWAGAEFGAPESEPVSDATLGGS